MPQYILTLLYLGIVCHWLKSGCSESRSVMSSGLQPYGQYSPWDSPGQNTRVHSLSLLQGIFPFQGLNPGLPHGKQILAIWKGAESDSRSVVSNFETPILQGQNTGVGSLSLLQGSSQPRDQTQVSHIPGRFFTSWATQEAQEYWSG